MPTATPISADELRGVMRFWATGVAVLTTRAGDARHGMTVSSFTSISLTPPLVLVCVEQGVRTHRLLAEAGVFALSLLGVDQAAISDRFAGRETEAQDRLAGLPTFTAVTGAPILADHLAYLDCRVVAAHPSADHTIFVAEVLAAAGPGGETSPLLYFNRGYHRLS